MERSTMFKNGKSSISMGHLFRLGPSIFHGYVTNNQMVTQDKAVNPKVREAAVIYSLAEAPAGQLVPMGFAPWKASFIRDYIIYKGLPIAMCDFRKAYGLANCWNWTWQGELPISQEFNGEIIPQFIQLVQDFFHPLYVACCIGQLLLVVCLKGNPLGYRPEIQPWALHRTPNTGASMGSFPDISDSSSNPTWPNPCQLSKRDSVTGVLTIF